LSQLQESLMTAWFAKLDDLVSAGEHGNILNNANQRVHLTIFSIREEENQQIMSLFFRAILASTRAKLWFHKTFVRDHRRKRLKHFSTFSSIYMVDWNFAPLYQMLSDANSERMKAKKSEEILKADTWAIVRIRVT
jgi:hypothetical protein